MPRTLTRRSALLTLGGALTAVTFARSASAQQVAAEPGPQQALIEPGPQPMPVEAGPTNVWAATMGPLAEGALDLPPRVYVPHEIGGDIAVIDPLSRTIVDRFFVGRTPHHVTPAYDLTSLYVSVMGTGRLVQIDPWAGRPARSLVVAAPYNLYFTLDGSMAIVAAEPYNRLDFYDAGSWQPIARLPIPASGVDHLDLSADGKYLMVSGEFGGQLIKVDLERIAVAGVLRLGGLPIDVKLAPEGDLFYVANQGRHGVSIVEPESLTEIGFLPTGRGAHGMAISRDTRYLYVSNRLAGTISVVEFTSRSILATWPIGGSPDMLQVSPDGTELWASGRAHGAVYVVDTRTGQLLDRIRTGAAPHGLTYFPQPGRFSIGHNGVYR
ncbi:MAG: YncE family protein [Chloroflexota bacterium]|nr:YncE family protein [Chloroflexota bacterium]